MNWSNSAAIVLQALHMRHQCMSAAKHWLYIEARRNLIVTRACTRWYNKEFKGRQTETIRSRPSPILILWKPKNSTLTCWTEHAAKGNNNVKTWLMPSNSWGLSNSFSSALDSVPPSWLHPLLSLLSSCLPWLNMSKFSSVTWLFSLALWVPVHGLAGDIFWWVKIL